MTDTYCGKNCEECASKEALNCPGCKSGPGSAWSGDCEIAKCRKDKGHETAKHAATIPAAIPYAKRMACRRPGCKSVLRKLSEKSKLQGLPPSSANGCGFYF